MKRLIDIDRFLRTLNNAAHVSESKIMSKIAETMAFMIEAQWVLFPEKIKESEWIPCSDRLPEEGHDVLITKEPSKIKGYEQKVIKAKRSADPRSGKIEWWSPEFGTLTNKAVLAWMPLPEPYRGEQE